MKTLETLKSYYKTHVNRILEDYFTFLSFKSISSEKEYQPEVLRCADWVKEYLAAMGFDVELWDTPGHPTLFATNLKAGPDKPTLLIYNHYDVQPVDPLELWTSPPFSPTIKDNNVYARGAQDNKGQCMYVLQAIRATLETQGSLPVNVKWIIEGEEETGSKGLAAILKSREKQLKADYLAVFDLGIPGKDKPAITLGVRGILTMDVEAVGSNTDLHSGTHGGRTYNPIHALTEILSRLRDSQGKIRVPGFYDDVVELTAEEKKNISFDFDENAYFETFRIKATGGEKAYPPLERSTIRPTIEVNGIWGGYNGPGFKTVIPAKAFAKISCRLVPYQEPAKIGKAVAQYIESLAPEGIDVKVHLHEGGGPSVRAESTSKIVQAFSQAYSEVFDRPCKYAFEGGSIPIISKLQQTCGGKVILLGLALEEDQIHAPNEHFGLDRLEKGFLITARGLELLGQS